MRLMLGLALVGLVGFAHAQPVITEVQEISSGRSVRDGGIFEPSSSLKVKVNVEAIRKKVQRSGDSERFDNRLQMLQTIGNAAGQGLAALNARQNGNINTGAVSDALNNAQDALDNRPDLEERLNKIIASSLRTAGSDPNRIYIITALVFEELIKIGKELEQELLAEVRVLRVRMTLARDPDASRQPEAQFGILPSQESAAKVDALLGQLGVAEGAAGSNPETIRKALLNRMKAQGDTLVNGIKAKAEALVAGYRAKLNTAKGNLTGSAKENWDKIEDKLELIESSWTTIKSDFAAIGETSDTAIDFSARVNRIQNIWTQANAMKTTLAELPEAIEAAARGLSGLPKAAAEELRTLVANADADVKAFVKDAENVAFNAARAELATLNLIDDYQLIGERLKDLTDGEALFENNDGSLENLPKTRSYDRVRFEVIDGTERVGSPYNVYAWKSGRLDNITALGFSPQKNSNKWESGVVLGQAFKLTDRKASFATNRNLLPGVGYSVMNLDADDDGEFEPGIGLMLTLLDDRIIGGYGYNLAGKGTYWYAGYRFRL